MMLRRYLLLLLLPVLLYSCEKPEQALVLPPPSGASHDVLDLGPDYDTQIFYDLASGQAVHSSNNKSWHLAFESGADQRHMFVNGGQKVCIYNTHKTSMDAITELPDGLSPEPAAYSGWSYDMPNGMSDSTGMGDWFDAAGNPKGEVYLVKYRIDLLTAAVIKMRILSLSNNIYRFEWAPIQTKGSSKIVELPKDPAANFSYYSFTEGQTFLEPAKDKWDIVFTHYRHVYRNYIAFNQPPIAQFPYEVTGVLSNPGRTRAVPDSLTGFENITKELAATKTPSPYRDVIGFDWKSYDASRQPLKYIVKRMNCFMIWTQHNEVYKLHFLDFVGKDGEKGQPTLSFEYLRLQ